MALASLVGAFAAGCGGGPQTPVTTSAPPIIQVVTTSVILADLVKNVGGGRVEVQSIVQSGADIHSFQSTPGDSVAISNARVIVSNGMGLDAFLEGTLQNAKGRDAVHVVAAEALPANLAGNADPHFWQDPLYTVYYVQSIRDGLIRADPAGARIYHANTEAYIRELRDLDGEIAETLSMVPPEKRHLVTFHDAFGHFAERYGWEVSALVMGDADDITPGAVVEVIARIKGDGISAVFAEPQFSSDMIRQAASDAGVQDIGLIYSDVLDAEVPTYMDMMRFNAKSLLKHLR